MSRMRLPIAALTLAVGMGTVPASGQNLYLYSCEGVVSQVSTANAAEIARFDAVALGLANRAGDGCALASLRAEDAPLRLIAVTPKLAPPDENGEQRYELRSARPGETAASIALEPPSAVSPMIVDVIRRSPATAGVGQGAETVLLRHERSGVVRLAGAATPEPGGDAALDLDAADLSRFTRPLIEAGRPAAPADASLLAVLRAAINTGSGTRLHAEQAGIRPPDGPGWFRIANLIGGGVFIRQLAGGSVFAAVAAGSGPARIWRSGRAISANDTMMSADLGTVIALARADGVLVAADSATMAPIFERTLPPAGRLALLCAGPRGNAVVRSGDKALLVDRDGIRPVTGAIAVDDQTACSFGIGGGAQD